MPNNTCPLCETNEILTTNQHHECLTCGHEWHNNNAQDTNDTPIDPTAPVLDAYGNTLQDGDTVAMIKDIKLKGTSTTLKVGTKSKPIRLHPDATDGHQIACKMDNISLHLKACFVKKINP